jgi:hypothetical protein
MTASMKRAMPLVKRIALVAHGNKKQDLLEWAAFNRELLKQHALYATGNTGNLLRQKLGLDVPVLRVRDGRKGQSFMRNSRGAAAAIEAVSDGDCSSPLKSLTADIFVGQAGASLSKMSR